MRGGRVALSWSGECGGGEVRLARTSGGTRVLTRFPGGCAAAQESYVFGISISSGFVYWTLRGSDPELAELRRYDRSGHREERAKLAVNPWTTGFCSGWKRRLFGRAEE
jgi:hypothetical protein